MKTPHTNKETQTDQWYLVKGPEHIDSPALLVYRDRVGANIETMISIAGSPSRLMPHVKTHKMEEIVRMQVAKGITRFKCATIAEAEMTARAGAEAILLAYQLNMPKVHRYLELVRGFSNISWSSLVDNIDSARLLKDHFKKDGLVPNVYIDIDNGMHRTGIATEHALALAREIRQLDGVRLVGLHVYDGHIRDADFDKRWERCEAGMQPVLDLAVQMEVGGFGAPEIVAGGTPSFTVHALHQNRVCSPGTCLLWDRGYGQVLAEQPFLPAAVLMTRVISRPGPGIITTDLGHKSVSAENPIDKRIFFLNLDKYQVLSQSEEHLVVQVEKGKEPEVGTVLYGVPYHVCPSVALHDEARVISEGEQVAVWQVVARKRKISV